MLEHTAVIETEILEALHIQFSFVVLAIAVEVLIAFPVGLAVLADDTAEWILFVELLGCFAFFLDTLNTGHAARQYFLE